MIEKMREFFLKILPTSKYETKKIHALLQTLHNELEESKQAHRDKENEWKAFLNRSEEANIRQESESADRFLNLKESIECENRRVLEVSERIGQELKSDLQEEIQSISRQYSEISQIQEKVLSVASMLRIQVPYDRVIYQDILPEKKTFIDRFVKDMDAFENPMEEYKKLVFGLDEQSVETVERIIQRCRRIAALEAGDVDLYSLAEQDLLREMFDRFDRNIVPLCEDVYTYRNYYFPINYFNPTVLYYRHGLEELRTLEFIKSRDIIDAGAFIGDSAVILSEYTDGVVHSFEAIESNYTLLQKTLQYNGICNVEAVNKAIADKSGQISFYLSDIMDESSMISTSSESKEIIVNCVSIDEYVKAKGRNIGLIKTDVEGAEKELIKGAMDTIKSQRPTLLISIYHSASDFFHIKTMLEELDLNYVFRIYRPPMRNVLTDTVLIAECSDHFKI